MMIPNTLPTMKRSIKLPGQASRDGTIICAAFLAGVSFLFLAWQWRFVLDDAFISFRYAEHLAQGLGLVWNPGDAPIEGYSNFLWVLLMGLGARSGLTTVFSSQLLGLICFGLSLPLLWRLAHRVTNSIPWALGVVLLVGGNASTLAFATSGLATALQSCLILLAFNLALAPPGGGGKVSSTLLSLTLAAALLTRPDSGLALILILPAWNHLARHPRSARMTARLLLVAPVILIVAAWLTWKMKLYGGIVPLPGQLKVSGFPSLVHGLHYLIVATLSYGLFLLTPLLPMAWLQRGVIPKLPPWPIFAFASSWLLYLIWVGGDFMEFRMLVPVLPYLALILAWLIRWTLPAWPRVQAGLVLLLLLGSLHHALSFGRIHFARGIESVSQLQAHIDAPARNWRGIGITLGNALGDGDVCIATTAAGAIPFYSELTTIDMLGLNDLEVAREGVDFGTRSGHRRIATLDQLNRRGTHLVIGHPWVRGEQDESPSAYGVDDLRLLWLMAEPKGTLPEHARMLEIPLPDGYRLVVLYLRANQLVEAAIRDRGWRVLPIHP